MRRFVLTACHARSALRPASLRRAGWIADSHASPDWRSRFFSSSAFLRESKDREGHIHATSSGLFKLTLPLKPVSPVARTQCTSSSAPPSSNGGAGASIPLDQVNFLLHPRQPLSFLSGLIAAETASSPSPSSPPVSPTAAISAQSVTFHGSGDLSHERWASATELGDFVRDSSRASRFLIRLTPSKVGSDKGEAEREIVVRVPSFEQRTWHLRARLRTVSAEMEDLLKVKAKCDELARTGAKRFALGGLAGLGGYWYMVYHLTFHLYGWDVMEPVTYLVGLTTIMGGYLWFLWHQKEVSYRAAFEITTSRRRQALYDTHGFNSDRWQDIVDEGVSLRRSIAKLAAEYGVEWHAHNELAKHTPNGEKLGKSRTADILRNIAEKEEGASGEKKRREGLKKEDKEEEAEMSEERHARSEEERKKGKEEEEEEEPKAEEEREGKS